MVGLLLWWRRPVAPLAVALATLLAAHAPLRAQAPDLPDTPQVETPGDSPVSPPPPPGPVRRVAASFDFEEHDNPYPVPRFWGTAQDAERTPRPGYPRFNHAEFDFSVAHTGQASVKLPTSGGSTSLRLSAGVIPVFAEGDYAISAWVRTADLHHARAVLIARLLDQASRPLDATEVRSEPIVTPGGAWQQVTLSIIGAPEGAAYMQLDLELRQPRQLAPPRPVPTPEPVKEVWPEDLAGAVWFDDIVVHQLPRVELSTGAPANIVLMPDRPVVRILVRDFVGERLDGSIVVTDVDGNTVQSLQTPLATAGRPQEWSPSLPAFGWYHISLSVLGEKPDGGRYRVGGADLAFLWLDRPGATRAARPAEAPRLDRDRFGIIADRVDHGLLPALPNLARRIGTGFISIPVWSHRPASAYPLSREDITASLATFGQHIDALAQAGQKITVCVPGIPDPLIREFQIDPDDTLALADLPPEAWMPFLHPILDRYGQRLTRWQAGRAGTDAAFWRPDLPGSADRFAAHLAALVPGPRLALPWRAEYAPPIGLTQSPSIASLVLSYPAAFEAGSIRTVLDAFAPPPRASSSPTPDTGEIVFVPEILSEETFGHRAGVIEFARRAVEFWAARTAPGSLERPMSLAIDHPWSRGGAPHRAQLLPTAPLGALRTLVDHLAERRILGEYPVTPGIKCFILADIHPARGTLARGALVAWNESAAPGEAVISRFLGDGPIEIVDLFGNRAPVERSTGVGGPHIVHVGDTPVFIEGIDPFLAQFCTQLRLTAPFLPAVQTEHDLGLVITNPWPQAITGKLQIIPPSSTPTASDSGAARRRWIVTPDGIIPFALGAGQTKTIPWSVAFPFFEETGDKHFGVVVRVASDRELPPILLPMTFRVGLQDLALEPEVTLGPRLNGPDVIITATVSNRGERSRMLKLEAVAPGTPTQQTLIADLPGGEAVIKRIILKGLAAQLSGKRVHLALSDAEEQERLNMSVLVP